MRLSVRILGFWLVLTPLLTFAQTTRSTLEFFNESLLGGTYNGPNAGVPDVRFRENVSNPTDNRRQDYSPDIFVNYGYFNHQYTNVNGIPEGRAATFGARQNLSGVDPVGENIWQPLGSGVLGTPSGTVFTSSSTNPGGTGTGISTSENHGIIQFTSARGLQVANSPTSGRYFIADFTYRFARSVSNPILHLAGLGDSFGSGTTKLGYTTELDILNAGMTLSKVSGTSSLVVSNTQITNNASIADLGASSAAGSIRINAQNITEVTFRVYLRVARGSSNPSWPANTHLGDTFSTSWSFATPIDLLVTNTTPNLTPNVGANITFTIQATNTSLWNGQPDRPASGSKVLAILPAGLQYVAHNAPAGTTYNPITGIWTVGELASNSSKTLTLTANVRAIGNYNFFASISGDQRDPNLTNNVANKTVSPVGATGQVNCSNVFSSFLNETFGSGSNPGAPLAAGTTSYTYIAPSQPANFPNIVSDGQYVIASNSSFANTSWQAKSDHTGNANGYYMIVNADFGPGEFYRRSVTGLSPNTVYKISFWAINLNSTGDKNFCDANEGGLILPNIGFYAINPTTGIVGSGITGNLPFESNATWKNYSFTFQTGQETSVDLVLYNAAPGGCGNDLGVDDILVEECRQTISGSVFNDTNGLTDNIVNGALYAGSTPLFVSLVNTTTNTVVSTSPVVNGQYSFSNQPQREYRLVLHTQSGGSTSSLVPSEDWIFTGEFTNSTAGNDGLADGLLLINSSVGTINNANFGLQQRPTTAALTLGTPQVNPGLSNTYTLPATLFSGTDVSPGSLQSLRITSFPNFTERLIINGTVYTLSNFPTQGVTIPVNASGNPTQTIQVDPFEGNLNVQIQYKVVDNAGTESLIGGEVRQPFTSATFPATCSENLLLNGLTAVGSANPAALVVGDRVMKVDAIRHLGVFYDAILQITGLGTSGTASISVDGNLQIANSFVNQDPYITYRLTFIEKGSSTTLNPAGTPVALSQVWITLSDIDGLAGSSLADVGGFKTDVLPNQIIQGVSLTNAGFTNGGGPSGFQFYRPIQLQGINAATVDVAYGVQTFYTNYPSTGIELLFGITGSRTTSVSNRGQGLQSRSQAACDLFISGKVFHDADGPSNGISNGSAAQLAGLRAVLVNAGNSVIANVPVDPMTGLYQFNTIIPGTYQVILTTANPAIGSPAPTSTLPSGWISTGEFNGTGTGNDGTTNGILPIQLTDVSTTQANFGINARPTAGSGSSNGTNPGGLIQIPFPANAFTNTTPSTDITPGSVTAIRVVSFPSGATSVIINEVNYTTATWPTNGVVVPTNSTGLPTQAITVDPSFVGPGSVVFSFRAVDSGGAESSNSGTATLNLVTTPILAVADDFQDTGINNATGGSPGNVLTNDLLNNLPVTSAQVVTTLRSNGGVTGLTLNASGQLQVPAGAPVGIFMATYDICEVSNPANCSQAEITFRVISTTGGGNSSTPCNVYTPLTPAVYTNLSVANSTGLFGGDNWNNKGRLIDSDLNNSASWTAVLLGSAWIEARDLNATGANAFPAGYYAGMVINDLDLLSLGASVRITTYLGNTEQESETFGSLLSTLLDGGGRRRVGFITTKPFNRIRLSVNAGITVIFTINAFYAEVFKPCPGPEPVCNVNTTLNRPTYAAVIEPTRTGFSGVSVGSISNTDNLVNANSDDFATVSLNVGILASASVSVRNLAETFPAGYFAGFDLSNSTLLGLNLLGNVTIQTYLNGVLRQTVSANNLVLDLPILSGSDRQTVGFITNLSFNEIRLTLNQPVGINLGSTRVYNAVVKRYCAGPALDCNTSTSLISPTYPVLINTARTGIDGLACIGCSIDNPERIINSSLSDFTNVVLVAGVGISGSVSVQDPLTDYAAGTFAGFDIQNSSLLSADILNGLTIRTYLNGTLRETKSGLNDLISVGTSLLTDDGRRTVGFITTQSFDEVRINLSNTVSVNLGTTRIYQLVLKRFCAVDLECNQTYFLKEPTAPVVINSLRTGIDGLACVICSVENANNAISPANNDFATVTVAAGILSSGSISVLDGITTYPRGSTAGFVIQDVNNLIQLDLFTSLSICTYNNGVLQECASGSQLIDLALLVNLIGQGPGIVNVGFRTTKDYDEVRLTVSSLASVLNIIRVYSGYVDTRGVTDPSFNCCPSEAPKLSGQVVQNTCPATHVNLNALVTSATPLNSTLVWFNGPNPNSATLVANPTMVTQSGQYFAFYYNQTAPNNCYSPASVEVTATIRTCLVANDDNAGPVQSTSGGQNIVRVRLNDTNNGGSVDSLLVSTQLVGSLPAGLVFNEGGGTVSVNAGTPVGVYTFQYRLCELANPTNCDTATVTVSVVQAQIQDVICSNNGTFNTSADDFVVFKLLPSVALPYNVTATFGGSPVSIVQLDNSPATGIFGGLGSYFKIPNGSLGVGNFTLSINYQNGFSETLNFANTLTCSEECTTASTGNISTVLFASPISTTELNSAVTLPKFDAGTRRILREVKLTLATELTSKLTFDSINPNSPVEFKSSTRLFFNWNSVGVVDTVVLFTNPSFPSTDLYPVGSYTLERPLIVSKDSIQYTSASDLAPFIGPGEVNISFATLTFTTASNAFNFTQTTKAGYVYRIDYIYDCLPLVSAVNDTSQVLIFQGAGGTAISNVRNNDLINGAVAGVGNSSLSIVGIWPSGVSLNLTSGQVQVDAAVSSGDFSLEYQLCDALNPSNCDRAFVVFTVSPPPFVKLLPKVYLQGSLYGVALPDTLMRDDLRAANRLPVAHPYAYLSPVTSVPSVNPVIFSTTGPNAIVDWVFVELRSSSDSTVVVDSRAGLLQRDGDIVEVDGVSPLQFGVATNSQAYFVAVRHRNHLGVMSERPLAMSTSGLVVDFRKATTPTFRFTSAALNQAQVVVQQGRALWAGNAERDRQIIYQGTVNDLNPIYTRVIADPLNIFVLPTFKSRGYLNEDIDMNGEAVFQGTGNDLEFIYQNVISNHPGNVFVLPFFTIREQLP